MAKRGRRRAHKRRRNWQAPAVFCGFAAFFATPACALTIPVVLRVEPYDGKQMYLAALFLSAAVALISWVPHFAVIDDGYLPAFNHEKNTAALFWYLVAMTTLCGLLVGLAPTLPLLDGYDFTTWVPLGGSRGRVAELPLWLVTPLLWAVAAVVFSRVYRGLRLRLAG